MQGGGLAHDGGSKQARITGYPRHAAHALVMPSAPMLVVTTGVPTDHECTILPLTPGRGGGRGTKTQDWSPSGWVHAAEGTNTVKQGDGADTNLLQTAGGQAAHGGGLGGCRAPTRQRVANGQAGEPGEEDRGKHKHTLPTYIALHHQSRAFTGQVSVPGACIRAIQVAFN